MATEDKPERKPRKRRLWDTVPDIQYRSRPRPNMSANGIADAARREAQKLRVAAILSGSTITHAHRLHDDNAAYALGLYASLIQRFEPIVRHFNKGELPLAPTRKLLSSDGSFRPRAAYLSCLDRGLYGVRLTVASELGMDRRRAAYYASWWRREQKRKGLEVPPSPRAPAKPRRPATEMPTEVVGAVMAVSMDLLEEREPSPEAVAEINAYRQPVHVSE